MWYRVSFINTPIHYTLIPAQLSNTCILNPRSLLNHFLIDIAAFDPFDPNLSVHSYHILRTHYSSSLPINLSERDSFIPPTLEYQAANYVANKLGGIFMNDDQPHMLQEILYESLSHLTHSILKANLVICHPQLLSDLAAVHNIDYGCLTHFFFGSNKQPANILVPFPFLPSFLSPRNTWSFSEPLHNYN